MDPIASGRPFTRDQLEQLGLSRARLSKLLAEGALRRILRNVYVGATTPDDLDLRVAALRLVLAPDQVVVDRTAAWLLGVDCYTAAEQSHGAEAEVCVLRGGTRCRHTSVRGRSRDLLPADITDVAGIPCTSPLRTALDLGCNLRRREAFAALCGLARAYGIDEHSMGSELARFRGRRGVIQLRELLPLVDARLESPREAWTLLAIIDAGVAAPEPQHWIVIDGVPTYRLDFAYVAQRVCIEYNGFDAHERTTEQVDNDAERAAWLRENHWTVIVVRSGDFSGPRLDAWLRELRLALRPSYTPRRW
ncbi:type IV toxin-antitoxin system AbiEi family antitoxin domain-containing protein [Nocardioides ultimimeridianus]